MSGDTQSESDSNVRSVSEDTSFRESTPSNQALTDKAPTTLGWAKYFTICVIIFELLGAPFSSPSPNLAGFVFISCNLALASIASIWCALRSRWILYVMAVFALMLNGWLLAYCTGVGNDVVLMLLPLAIAIPTSLTLEGIKLFFGKFAIATQESNDFDEGLQFATIHLFIATFVVALVCAVSQALYTFAKRLLSEDVVYYEKIFTILVIASILSISALFIVWALMGKRIGFRIPLTFLLAVSLIVAGKYLIPGVNLAVWIVITSLPCLATAILLFLLRGDGYRFVRTSKLSS